MAFATIPAWSTTAGTNTEIDGISLAENVMVPSAVNNAFREMMSQVAEFTRRGSDLASADPLNLDSIDTMFLDITGTTTVTAVTLTDGHSRRARATGAFQLTASATLVVNGSTSSNYTTTAGDLLFFEGYGASTVRVWVMPAGVSATQPQGQHTIWVPAGAMVPATTSGAASGTGETSSNKVMRKTLDFDTTSEEFAQFFIQMPKSWNEGTLIAQYVWSHAATVTNFGVAWGLEAVAFANDDTLDAAWGTEVVVTDTGGTTDDIYITDESSAVTVAGTPAAEEFVAFRITRVVGNAGDTLAVDARLHGIKIHYTTDANTDS